MKLKQIWQVSFRFLPFLFILPIQTSTVFAQQTFRRSLPQNERGLYLSNIQQVARLTGTPLEGEGIPSPNNTAENFDVGGTDLGIFWKMDSSRVGIFFGDTKGKLLSPAKEVAMVVIGVQMFLHFHKTPI